MKRTYLVVFEKGPTNYSGFAPDVPGCISVGDSLEEMRTHFQEAIELWMEAAVEFNEPIPEPSTRNIVVPLEGETDIHSQYNVEWVTVEVPEYASHQNRRAA